MSSSRQIRAVLFKSQERFASFQERLEHRGIAYDVLDFASQDWISYDYTQVDLAIYYSGFEYSSNHPLALHAVHDNIMFIHSEYPHLKFYPDPNVVNYYNDKYRQYLFLKAHKYPIAPTVPLLSKASFSEAETLLGYPMVIKNRFGAGGESVFLARDLDELKNYYALSTLDMFNMYALRTFLATLRKRSFYYHLMKARRVQYPFLSPPLIAQKFVTIERDLKTVVGNYRVVEGHWRIQADKAMWKMNIDGGGIGEWSRIPEHAISLSERLARDLRATWLNIDLIISGENCLISEFSPVWHHYRYKEKPNFVYKDDYNIDIPVEIACDLETMIVDSLMRQCSSNHDKTEGN